MTAFYTFRKQKLNHAAQQLLLLVGCCFVAATANAQCNPDTTPPIAICNSSINVALDINGTAVIPASVIDEGSNDNCCLGDLFVKRLDSTCLDYPNDDEEDDRSLASQSSL